MVFIISDNMLISLCLLATVKNNPHFVYNCHFESTLIRTVVSVKNAIYSDLYTRYPQYFVEMNLSWIIDLGEEYL